MSWPSCTREQTCRKKCVEACDDTVERCVIRHKSAGTEKKLCGADTEEQQHVYDQRNNVQEDEEVIEEALLREQREKEELPKLEKEIVNKVANQNLADNIIAATEKEIAETVMQHTTDKRRVPSRKKTAADRIGICSRKAPNFTRKPSIKRWKRRPEREKEEQEKFEKRFNTAELQEELQKVCARLWRESEENRRIS